MNEKSANDEVAQKGWKFNRKFLQLIFIGICVAIAAWHIIHNREDLVQLKNFSLKHIIGLYVGWLILNFISAHRSLFVYSELGLKGIRYRQWLKIYFIALYLGSNFWQGGKVYRTLMLKKHFAVSYTNSIVFSLFMGWYQAISSLIIANIFILCSDLNLKFYGVNVLAVTSGVLVIGVAVPFIGHSIFPIKGLKGKKLQWVQSKILDLFDQIKLCGKPKLIFGLIFYGCLELPMIALSVYVFYHGFNVALSFFETMSFTIINILVASFPITPQNMGVTEIIYGFMSESVGVAFGNSMILVAGLRILTMMLMAIMAIFLEKSIDLKVRASSDSDQNDGFK